MRSRVLGLAHDEKARATKYILVGAVSFGLDIAILSLCWHVLRMPLLLATSLGFWASFGVNFLLSRHWTFGAAHLSPGGQLKRYAVLVGVNYLVTLLTVTALHRAGLDVVVARTIVLAILTISTYILYRRWVFVDVAAAGG